MGQYDIASFWYIYLWILINNIYQQHWTDHDYLNYSWQIYFITMSNRRCICATKAECLSIFFVDCALCKIRCEFLFRSRLTFTIWTKKLSSLYWLAVRFEFRNRWYFNYMTRFSFSLQSVFFFSFDIQETKDAAVIEFLSSNT